MKKALIVGMWLGMALSASAGIIVWDNTGGGVWSAKANWKPKQVPRAGDTAVITNSGNFSVTLDVAADISGLVLGAGDGTTQTFAFNGQTLSLDGVATINSGGQMDFSSGTFNGDTSTGGADFNGTLTCAGGVLAGKFTLGSNSVLNLAATNALSSLVLLTNYGTVNWGNTDLVGASGLQLFNQGLWLAQGNNTFIGNGTVFKNSGTFRKSAIAGVTLFDTNTTFNTTGTVELQTNGKLTVQKGNGGGDFSLGSGTILTLGGSNNFELTSSSSFTGTGLVFGKLTGAGGGGVDTAITFSGITFSNTLTIASNGVLNFNGSSGPVTLAGVLTNYGTVIWTNTDLYSLSGPSVTPITVYNHGLWVVAGNNFLQDGTGGIYPNLKSSVFFNAGTLRKATGTGISSIQCLTANAGTIDVQMGTLSISRIYATNSAVFNTASNAVIKFHSILGNYVSVGNTMFSGSGTIQGSLATYSGGSNVVSSGSMIFSNTSMSGPFFVASNAAMNVMGGLGLNGVQFYNFGTVSCSSGLTNTTSSQIYNFGLWDSTINAPYIGGSGLVFHNYGVFRKSGGVVGMGSTYLNNNVAFNNYNTGTLDAQKGMIWLGGPFSLEQGALNCGIDSPTDFGTFYLSGTGSLSGVLSVNLNNGFSPSLSNAFALVYYPAAIGTFPFMNLPPLSSGRMWQPDYGATAFTLSVVLVPSPTLTAPTLTGGNSFSFAWASVPGQIYQVQFATNLAPVNWLDLGSSITATNTTQSVTYIIGVDPQRFYRVVMP